jgi:hypothetical protein
MWAAVTVDAGFRKERATAILVCYILPFGANPVIQYRTQVVRERDKPFSVRFVFERCFCVWSVEYFEVLFFRVVVLNVKRSE